MNIFVSKIILPGLLFLFTIGSGFWLSHSGKPLNVIIFTIHKLIALAMVILTAGTIYNLLKNVEIKIDLMTLMFVTGLLVISLFITGAMLSPGKPINALILTIHKVTPLLTVFATTATIYLLVGGQ